MNSLKTLIVLLFFISVTSCSRIDITSEFIIYNQHSTIGVINGLPDDFYHISIGLTIFEQESKKYPVDWDIGEIVASEIEENSKAKIKIIDDENWIKSHAKDFFSMGEKTIIVDLSNNIGEFYFQDEHKSRLIKYCKEYQLDALILVGYYPYARPLPEGPASTTIWDGYGIISPIPYVASYTAYAVANLQTITMNCNPFVFRNITTSDLFKTQKVSGFNFSQKRPHLLDDYAPKDPNNLDDETISLARPFLEAEAKYLAKKALSELYLLKKNLNN